MLAPLLTTAMLLLTCSGYQAPLPQQDLPSTQDVGQELRELIFLSPEQRFNLVEDQRKKRFFWDWPKKEKTNRRYGMWITAMNKEGNRHQKNFYDGVDRWTVY